jgi:hypothetical protein
MVHLAFIFAVYTQSCKQIVFILVQGHLISSQLFIFLVFLFLVKQEVVCKEGVYEKRDFKNLKTSYSLMLLLV